MHGPPAGAFLAAAPQRRGPAALRDCGPDCGPRKPQGFFWAFCVGNSTVLMLLAL